MKKKASFEWGEVVKFILLLLAIIVVILLISMFKGGYEKSIESLKELFGI